MDEYVCRICGDAASVDVTNSDPYLDSGSYCAYHGNIPDHLKDLPPDAPSVDVIQAINDVRAMQRAMRLLHLQVNGDSVAAAPIQPDRTVEQFTVRVEVIDAVGNITFALTVPATKDDLVLPDHATPGVTMVLDHLVKVTK